MKRIFILLAFICAISCSKIKINVKEIANQLKLAQKADLNTIVEEIIQASDTISDELSFKLLRHFDPSREHLYHPYWEESDRKKYKSYHTEVNLDQDKENEVIIRLFNAISTIYVFDYREGNWILLEKLDCQLFNLWVLLLVKVNINFMRKINCLVLI